MQKVLLIFQIGVFTCCLTHAAFCAESPRLDSDDDGWPDQIEKALGTDPGNRASTPNSNDDPDQDGLSNQAESVVGTDPSKPDTDGDGLSDNQETMSGKSDPCRSDSDSDGLSDFDEVLAETNPRDPDTDGDQWLDGAEHTAGSNPLDANSTPIIK